jgi:hypothetical protein
VLGGGGCVGGTAGDDSCGGSGDRRGKSGDGGDSECGDNSGDSEGTIQTVSNNNQNMNQSNEINP